MGMPALLARRDFDYRRVASGGGRRDAETMHLEVIDGELFGVGRLFVRAHLKANPAGGGWLSLGAHASNGGPAEALVLEPAVGTTESGGSSPSRTRLLAELNGALGANVRLGVVGTEDVNAQMIVLEVGAEVGRRSVGGETQ